MYKKAIVVCSLVAFFAFEYSFPRVGGGVFTFVSGLLVLSIGQTSTLWTIVGSGLIAVQFGLLIADSLLLSYVPVVALGLLVFFWRDANVPAKAKPPAALQPQYAQPKPIPTTPVPVPSANSPKPGSISSITFPKVVQVMADPVQEAQLEMQRRVEERIAQITGPKSKYARD